MIDEIDAETHSFRNWKDSVSKAKVVATAPTERKDLGQTGNRGQVEFDTHAGKTQLMRNGG